MSSTSETTQTDLSVLTFKGEHAALGGIGIVHGLASNDELLLLLTISLGLSGFFDMFIGLTIFTLGVVIGMISYGTILKIPFAKFGQEKVMRVVNLTIAGLTLIYAFYIIFGGDTINPLTSAVQNLRGALYIIAIVLGIKHSLDADHVVAISSILLRAPSFRRTSTLAVAWALGHMATATIITYLLFTFRELFLSKILDSFEIIVAVMLIVIALLTIAWEFDIITFGKHSHGHESIDDHHTH